ncbi:unnamed protein product, partial [Mesorhabditis belari]|uniref:C-type lectin domain-containing protein n=1 Tax=Mesorhabditis belari TaxID=2138241 RepID=A0AAF3EE27_9BILA
MLKLLFVCLFLFFVVVFSVDPICPDHFVYQSDLNLCLFYRGETDSWSHARDDCLSDHGDLLSVHNTFQNNLLAQIQFNMTGENRCWLGAHRDQGNIWTWSDGTPLDYDRFFQSSKVGDCAYLDGSDRMWKITSCNEKHKWLCATNAIIPSTTAPPTTASDLGCAPPEQQPLYKCKKGWQYNPQTGYQYMVVIDQSYTNAESYCVNQGGHLVSIHSAAENDFVKNLCCTSACQTSHNNLYAFYLTGGIKTNGTFIWTDGSPFDYQHSICETDGEDNDIIYMMNFQGCNLCGQPGIWQIFEATLKSRV